MSYLHKAQIERLFQIRAQMDTRVDEIKDDVAKINESNFLVRHWKPGTFAVDDIRSYKDIPYRCVQAHTCTAEQNWTPPNVPALWMQYHGTSIESARPWIQPLGAHDIYKVNEYMIWTDGLVYKCIQNTNFSPADYTAAWEVQTA